MSVVMKKLKTILLLGLFLIYSSLFSKKDKRLEQGILEFAGFLLTTIVLIVALIVGIILLIF